MNIRFSILVALIVLDAVGRLPVHAETLAYADLVGRLTDMEHLATLPAPGEVGGLASSYDRASKYEAATDQYINWGANGDGDGIIREEGNGQVMAEIQGPGCIWRTWSAYAVNGHVKIYLDGSPTPAIDLPFCKYFRSDGPFGSWPHLAYIQTSNFCQGSNNFIPISFQKSCKIIGDKGDDTHDSKWGGYFQFTYTRFAPGTVVPTFRLPISTEDRAALTRADHALANCAVDPVPRPGQRDQTTTVTVAPGQVSTVLNLTGPGAITLLKVKTALPDDDEAERTLLRQLTIRMTWNGAATPAVWAPLGDFFAYVGGAGTFATLPCGFTEGGTFYSHWYMPFGNGAKIEIGNDSATPVTLEVRASVAPLEAPLATLGCFHAKWHRDEFLPERKDRVPDWTLVKATGAGRFVGTMLHVWNPGALWWGEGDEKFFVDGEKFPSYFGTGSEDFFGYAWGCAGRFVQAFHAQPLNDGNCGHVDNVRWFIGDNVPFQKSFEGCIEKYFPNEKPREESIYADTSYWYLSADGNDPYVDAPPVDQRIGYWKRKVSYREPGVVEAESLHPIKWHSPAHVEDMWGAWPGPADAKAGLWSGDVQLAWPSALNEELELRLPVNKAGNYKFLIRPTKAPTYGIFQFFLDDKPIGTPVDFYASALTPANLDELATVQLSAGDHDLKIRNVGSNPAIKPGTIEFGLDYIKLLPEP